MIRQAYRFALDPSASQERMLRSHAGAARFAWNWGLAKCKERYAAEAKWYSAIDLHRLWNAAKKADPALAWWGENSKCAYQEAFRDLDRALRDFPALGRSGRRCGSCAAPPAPIPAKLQVRRTAASRPAASPASTPGSRTSAPTPCTRPRRTSPAGTRQSSLRT